MNKETAIQKELKDAALAKLNVEKSIFDLGVKGLDYLSQDSILTKNSLEDKILQNKYETERLSILNDIAKAQYVINNSKNSDQVSAAKDSVKELESRQTRLAQKQSDDEKVRQITRTNDAIDNARKEFDYKENLSKKYFEAQMSYDSARVTAAEEIANTLAGLGATSQVGQAESTKEINIAKERLRSAQALQALNSQQRM